MTTSTVTKIKDFCRVRWLTRNGRYILLAIIILTRHQKMREILIILTKFHFLMVAVKYC